jgi:hypothetical protein
MKSTKTDQTVHNENPMCSEKIENHRFRFATRLPVFSQNLGSSGSQWSIHRPPRAGIAGALASVVPIAPPELSVRQATLDAGYGHDVAACCSTENSRSHSGGNLT